MGKKPHGMVLIVSVGKPGDKDAKDMFKKPEKKVEKAALPGSERQVPLVGAVPAPRGMWSPEDPEEPEEIPIADSSTPSPLEQERGWEQFLRRNQDIENKFPGRKPFSFKRIQGGYTGIPKLAGEPIDIAMLLLKQRVGIL